MSNPQQPPNQGLDIFRKNVYTAAVVIPLSLVLFAYERALVPLYASGPTRYLLKPTIALASALAALDPVAVPISWNWLLLGLALTVAPNANYWVAVWTGRYGKPLLGVVTTHSVVLFPLVFLFTTAATNSVSIEQTATPSLGPTPLSASRPAIAHRITQAVIIYMMSPGLANDLWSNLAVWDSVSESKIYLGLASIFYLAWILTTPVLAPAAPKDAKGKPKKPSTTHVPPTRALTNRLIAAAGFIALFGVTYTYLENPVLPHPLPAPYTSPDESFRVLSAEQSVTGLITVVDWLPPKTANDTNVMHSARYLRASHSILGGVWTHDKVMVTDQDEEPLVDSYGEPLGDSIYATFVLQEAVRMVDSTKKAGKLDNALVIGLGIGTAATSLIRHGVSTTIVEIDPAVYKAARTYFGLPDPGADKVFIEDARSWVNKRKVCVQEGKCKLFDAAIHDCFSGGGVPEHIFTLEFWQDLKSIMDPDGVLVLNFAGVVNSDSTKLVLNTLLEAFGQCRAFHDYFEELTNDIYNTEFLNMVLFCTGPEKPLTFRKAKRSDYLGSPLRKHVLSSLESREVDLGPLNDMTGSYIITDQNNPLGKLQEAQGAHHWEVMRSVLPNSHWETY